MGGLETKGFEYHVVGTHYGVSKVKKAFGFPLRVFQLCRFLRQRKIDVAIEDSELCRRYTARVIEGVKVGETSDWLKERLTAHDLRPINNVVDVTNYILLASVGACRFFPIPLDSIPTLPRRSSGRKAAPMMVTTELPCSA